MISNAYSMELACLKRQLKFALFLRGVWRGLCTIWILKHVFFFLAIILKSTYFLDQCKICHNMIKLMILKKLIVSG